MGVLAVLYNRIRGVPSGRFIARQSSGTGRAEALTAAELRALASLYSQAQTDAAINAAALAGLHSVPYFADADVYLTPLGVASNYTIQTMTTNRLYHVPVLIHQAFTITCASINVTSGAAGSTIRLGIRSANYSTGQPTALLENGDFGTVDSSSIGTKKITGLSVSVNPGFYFFQAVTNGTPQVTAHNSASTPSLLGGKILDGTATNLKFLYRSFTYGALPADESAQSQILSNGNTLLIGVR